MSLRRLNRTVKSRAAKGKPHSINRHMTKRVDGEGQLREFHYTKGYRRKVD
jgi:hypothetical protein